MKDCADDVQGMLGGRAKVFAGLGALTSRQAVVPAGHDQFLASVVPSNSRYECRSRKD